MIVGLHAFAAAAALQGGIFGNYWARMVDPSLNPFGGLYQLNAFDLAIMIPYFAILVVLAAFGLHRYWLVYEFIKYRKNVPARRRRSTSGRESPCSFRSTTSAM